MTNMSLCLACEFEDTHEVHMQFPYGGTTYIIKNCKNCDSLFYDPLPSIDYSTHTESEESVRDYVELNAGVDILANFVEEVLSGRSSGTLLDIGCGYGFSTDIARTMGWDVTGVEPSHYGRVGANCLNIDISPDFLTPDHPIAQKKYDTIISSEVVEHIENPREFLKFLGTMLQPDGILSITVPCANFANSSAISRSEQLAVLSPGAHTVLFSKTGLALALSSAGFTHVEIKNRGVSLVARASKGKLPRIGKSTGIQAGVNYIRKVLERNPTDLSLRAGLTYRLFRYLVDLAQYKDAAELIPLIDAELTTTSTFASSWQDFMEKHRAFACPAHYYRGMIELNHFANYKKAKVHFIMAYELAITRIRVVPSLAVVESNIIWLALFHAGLASLYDGDIAAAKNIFDQFNKPTPIDLPAIEAHLQSQANERLKNL